MYAQFLVLILQDFQETGLFQEIKTSFKFLN